MINDGGARSVTDVTAVTGLVSMEIHKFINEENTILLGESRRLLLLPTM